MRLGPSVRLCLAACAFSLASATPVLLHAAAVQTAAAKTGIDDTWQGTLHAGKDLRTVVKITKNADGTLKAQWFSIDQSPRGVNVPKTTFRDAELRMDIEEIDGVYSGRISADGNTITGQWKQGGETLPLILSRATTATAWAMPEPPKPVAPMAADADPSWDIATIKLSPPDAKGKGFGGPPRHFRTNNTTLQDIINFAFDLNAKQVVGAPAWLETDHFDIVTGEPSMPRRAQRRADQGHAAKIAGRALRTEVP